MELPSSDYLQEGRVLADLCDKVKKMKRPHCAIRSTVLIQRVKAKRPTNLLNLVPANAAASC
jgi:hypothetical protein